MQTKLSAVSIAALTALLAAGCSGGSDTPAPDTSAPTVASVSPQDGATGVPRAGIVTITFSEPIDAASVTATSVTYEDADGGAVAYAASWDAASRVLTLTPEAQLANFAPYTVEVGTAVKDAAGNTVASAATYRFTSADDVAPGAIAAAPTDDGDWDDASVAFAWSASAADEGSGVAGYRVQIAADADATQVLHTADVAASATSVQYDASAAAHGAWLFARVAAVDAAGNVGPYSPTSDGIRRDAAGPVASAPIRPAAYSLDGSVAFSWSAATDAGVGTVASYEVEVATAVQDGTTLFAGNVATSTTKTVTGADGQTLYARVRADDGLGNRGEWSGWSAGATIDLTAPSVASIVPGDGVTGVARAGVVTVTFSEAIDPATATASTVTYRTAAGADVPYTPTLDDTKKVLTLTPATLGSFAGYTVDVGAGVKDLAGHPLAAGKVVAFRTVDDVAPVLVGGVTDAGEWDDATLTFSWTGATATDAGSGVAGYRVQLASAADPDQVFATTDVGDGTKVLELMSTAAHGSAVYARVAAIDAAQNVSTYSAWSDGIRIDRVGPVAGTPGPAGHSQAADVTFSWPEATDAGVGTVASYDVEVATAVQGGTTLFTGNVGTSTTKTVTGTDGQTLHARVRATDGLGNQGEWSSWSAGVTVDLIAPTVASIVPADGATGVDRAGVVQVTFSEAIDLATVTAATVTYQTAGGGTVAYGKALDPSKKVLSLTPSAGPLANYARYDVSVGPEVKDLAGHPIPAARTVSFTTKDDVAPVIAAAPTDRGAWDRASMTFEWDPATDDGSGLRDYEVELATAKDGQPFVVVPAGDKPLLTHDVSSLPNGSTVYARVRATDRSGNVGYSPWSDGVRLDRVGPVATAPTRPAAYSTTGSVTFSWAAATDDGIGVVQSYDFQLATATDGTGSLLVENVGTALAKTVTGTDGQTLYARVLARDTLGNMDEWSPWSQGVTVDLTAPSVASIVPGDGAVDVARTGVVTVTFSEALDLATVTAATVAYQTAGGADVAYAKALDATKQVLTLTPTSQLASYTAHTIRVTTDVKDLAGNPLSVASSAGFTTADDVPPALASAVRDAGPWDDATVSFEWDAASDAGSGVAGYELQVALAPTESAATSLYPATAWIELDASSYADGAVLYARVRALDVAGNASPWSGWTTGVTLDLAAPTAPGTVQDGGAASSERTLHLSWTPSDDGAGSGVAYYVVELHNSADATIDSYTTSLTSGEFAYTGPIRATVTAHVYAVDYFDHVSDSSASDGILVSDQVPGTPGTPEEVSPAVYASSTTLPFTWTAPTTGSAFDRYVIQVGGSAAGPFVDVATVPTTDAPPYDVSCAHAQTCFVRVAALNTAAEPDLQGAFSAPSDGIKVDTTAPSSPGVPGVTRSGMSLTFTWAAASDAESGVASYDVEILSDGTAIGPAATTPQTSYTFDASAHGGTSISARVAATNGAGITGASATSAPVAVDADAPWVEWIQPWDGTTSVATGTDVTVQFSEPMDRASVEAAFSLSWGATTPKNGYHFRWSEDSRTLTVAPDTADPAASTNVDVLPERTAVVVRVTTAAKDSSGNALVRGSASTFTTGDDSAPSLVSMRVDGAASPVPAASVQGGGFTLELTFSEEMDPTRGTVAVPYGNGWAEASYGRVDITSVTLGAGTATYSVWSCERLAAGDVVSVRDIQPPELELTRATVLAVDHTTGQCRFTVASSVSGVTWLGGGWAAIPQPYQGWPRWTSATTLEVTFEDWVTLTPGSDVNVELWDFSDPSWNYLSDDEALLQVAKAPGTDSTPPALLASIPIAGGTAGGSGLVVLRFTEPLDRGTTGTVSVQCDGTDCTGAYDLGYENDDYGPLLVLIPRRSPPDGTSVSVHVPPTVKDLAGNAMGTALSVAFTVAPSADASGPVLMESLPPSGRAVADAWDVQLLFQDSTTGALDPLDADSVGPEDVLVTDDSGWVSRGWRPQAEAASAFLRLHQPRGGLYGGWATVGVTSAQAIAATGSGPGTVTYQTSAPHGMLAEGGTVSVLMRNDQAPYGDSQFNVSNARVVAVPTPTSFAVEWHSWYAATSTGGGDAQVQTAKAYTVSILPAVGATGIQDLHGNALSPQVVDAMIQPWSGRVPTATDLRDVHVGAGTSPAGRQLELEFGLRDPDGGAVDVTVSLFDGATEIPLAEYSQTVDLHGWGQGWYWIPGDGPPTGDLAALGPIPSGLYRVHVTLSSEGVSTTYVRETYLWSRDDVPAIAGIVDDGTLRAPSVDRPIVVNGSTPTLTWTSAAGLVPDLVALYVGSLDGITEGGGYMEGFVVAPGATSLTTPTPLAADVYLWTVVAEKFPPGTFETQSSAWAIDLNDLMPSLFVVGPDNDLLAGAEFGGARIGFRKDGDGSATGIEDGYGLYAFESVVGAAPAFATVQLVDHTGTPVEETELFAHDAASGAFTLTDSTASADGFLPLPMRGAMGRDGTFFCVAEENGQAAALAVGASRYQTSGFGTTLTGEFVALMTEAWSWDPNPGFDENGAFIGTATFAADGTLAIDVVDHQNQAFQVPSAEDPGAIPYALTDDGLLSITIDETPAGAEYVRGLVGGAAGAEIVALAFDGSPDPAASPRSSWLFLARAYGWLGTEDESALFGTYRFANLSARVEQGYAQAHGANGTLFFDGAGTVRFDVWTPQGPMTGQGSYDVQPADERVIVTVPDGEGGTDSLTFKVGPDWDTLVGLGIEEGNTETNVLVVTR